MVIKEWSSSDYCSCDDFNRIEENIGLCYDAANETRPSLVTNRTYSYIDDFTSLNRIENAIKYLVDKYVQEPLLDVPKITWRAYDTISYKDMNRIERNIQCLYSILSIKEKDVYAGEIYSGEEVI